MNYPTTRAAARSLGAEHYRTGKPCRAGHVALRRTQNGECTACAKHREKTRWREQKSEMRARHRRWRANNPEYAKQRRKKHVEEKAGRERSDVCECCGQPQAGLALAFDHDHDTGAFRGWLCANCNVGIGKLGDTIHGVMRALAYLERHEKEKKKS